MNRILSITIAALALWACVPATGTVGGNEPATQAAPELRGDIEAARQGWQRIEQGALILDVRSEGEFAAGHLEGAVRVDYTDTEALAAAIGDDPERPVVLYCGSGRRAGIAQSALEELGYTEVFNASGLDALEATQP
ncbi:MAG: rhodanese-like domain-containing protein [Xanthomonadales bacterium]|nr:rhodanese-like domain-containing protein [Xanthomonadales bacterium]